MAAAPGAREAAAPGAPGARGAPEGTAAQNVMLQFNFLQCTNLGAGYNKGDVVVNAVAELKAGGKCDLGQSKPAPLSRGEAQFHYLSNMPTKSDATHVVDFQVLSSDGKEVVGDSRHGGIVELMFTPLVLPMPLIKSGAQVGLLWVEIQAYHLQRERAPETWNSSAASAPPLEPEDPGAEAGAPGAPGADAGAPGPGAAATIFLAMLGDPVPLAQLLRKGFPRADPGRNLSYLKAMTVLLLVFLLCSHEPSQLFGARCSGTPKRTNGFQRRGLAFR